MDFRRFFRTCRLCAFVVFLLGGCSQADSHQISALQAQELLASHAQSSSFVIIDVRTPEEFRAGHLSGAQLINYYDADFKEKIAALPKDSTYLFYCQSGNRSSKSLGIARSAGIQDVYDLDGGIRAWNKAGLPIVQ